MWDALVWFPPLLSSHFKTPTVTILLMRIGTAWLGTVALFCKNPPCCSLPSLKAWVNLLRLGSLFIHKHF